MAKYNMNSACMDNIYPYNIISYEFGMDGRYIEICYTVGIPDTVLYGKTETVEIYYYKNNNKSLGHYKSNCFSTNNGKLDKLPKKYIDIVHKMKIEYLARFGTQYSGSNAI